MTTNRSKQGGYCNPSKLPKGPNGRNLCRWCSTEVPKGRQTFCGEPCIHEWKVRTNPGYARSQVLKRDKGVCASCGLDCQKLEVELRTLKQKAYEADAGRPDGWAWRTEGYVAWPYRLDVLWPVSAKAFFIRCQEVGLKKPWRGEALWQADHIVPVVEGGGECGLEGLRTLCTRCHQNVTNELRRRLAFRKRVIRPT